MTADAAHVAAVAEAIRNALREWYEGDTCDVAASVAVETLTPLIRAQIAAEIRAMRTVCPAHGYPDCSPLLNGCSFPLRWIEREHAARIAEGTP